VAPSSFGDWLHTKSPRKHFPLSLLLRPLISVVSRYESVVFRCLAKGGRSSRYNFVSKRPTNFPQIGGSWRVTPPPSPSCPRSKTIFAGSRSAFPQFVNPPMPVRGIRPLSLFLPSASPDSFVRRTGPRKGLLELPSRFFPDLPSR